MTIFEKATRQKLRFVSPKGSLTVENLWDLPLTGDTSLDNVAKGIYRQLKELDEESFVSDSSHPEKPALELRLEIVKHIIECKKRERDERKRAQEKAAERQRLLEVLNQKRDDELKGLTRDQLERRLRELD